MKLYSYFRLPLITLALILSSAACSNQTTINNSQTTAVSPTKVNQAVNLPLPKTFSGMIVAYHFIDGVSCPLSTMATLTINVDQTMTFKYYQPVVNLNEAKTQCIESNEVQYWEFSGKFTFEDDLEATRAGTLDFNTCNEDSSLYSQGQAEIIQIAEGWIVDGNVSCFSTSNDLLIENTDFILGEPATE